jgi:hypothetical protein
MPLSVAKLSEYLNHGLNIYITGEAGTGKTQCLKQAAVLSKLKMGYMSAPTLDAYVDLVGIPVAEYSDVLKKKVLEFIRKGDFEDIEVLFIDELPRGELKTLNAVFEIIQFGTINGEIAAPKLRAVVAAGNPMTDTYTGQQQLDGALLDRFDIYLETDIAADLPYFIKTFGKATGKALVDWHKGHDHANKGYLSPRRLEKIGHTWKKMPEIGTLKAMVPPGGDYNVDLLQRQLEDSVRGSQLKADPSSPLAERAAFMSSDEIQKARDEITAALPSLNRADRAKVTEAVARALKGGMRVSALVQNWGPALEYLSVADKTSMMATWKPARSSEFLQTMQASGYAVGSKLGS